MTIDEKLERFDRICMEDARRRAEKMLKEYEEGLEAGFAEHQENARRQSEMQLQIEKEKIERELKRQVAVGQIEQRRQLSARQEELKGRILTELRNRLSDYMATEAYERMLQKRVEQALAFAGTEELVIYFDPADADKIPMLSLRCSARILESEYSFGGGMRAVIPSRHILMDYSFDTMVEEAFKTFKFKGEGV